MKRKRAVLLVLGGLVVLELVSRSSAAQAPSSGGTQASSSAAPQSLADWAQGAPTHSAGAALGALQMASAAWLQ